MDKQELRKQIRAAKKAVPFCEKCELSRPIMQQVELLPQFIEATTVLLYWSMEDEVQTHDFVNRWYEQKVVGKDQHDHGRQTHAQTDEVQTHDFVNRWYEQKVVLLPCVDGDDLRLRQYTGEQSMVMGEQFGIGEPVGSEFTELDKVDLIIVPGVAFDRKGNRMGRGRGFYDRLLKSTPNAYKVGVGFDFQLVESVPVEPFDVAMDRVIIGGTGESPVTIIGESPMTI